MQGWLWLIPALPLAGFALLALPRAVPRRYAACIGTGAVALSLLVAALTGGAFVLQPPPNYAWHQTLWQWLNVDGLHVSCGLHLDALSVVFVLVITTVGFAILLYSTRFMADSEGYARFFAYMNLFIAAMLILVLADNLLLLYLGWEGVGLCSYLLIGFWYADPANGRAARKAFIVTRIGDVALMVGLFLLFAQLGTLRIQALLLRATTLWAPGSGLATAAALLLLGGALGKSAQLPLQTWLPDAMAGPTPVSALIHAATMVTAGVYLIARMHPLFTLAPTAQLTVAWLGTATLLLAGLAAMTQRDIKRILAYSTMSQIGYMFLALGVGAWSAGLYHFVSHAFFKSALFLGAGILILQLHDEHDIFRMGGLRHRLPSTFVAMLLAALTLAAVPPLSLTFNSKELILGQVWSSPQGGPVLWTLATLGTLLTAFYTFRLIFVVFCGPARGADAGSPGPIITLPLLFLALGGGLAGLPALAQMLFHREGFLAFLQTALPAAPRAPDPYGELAGQLVSVLVSLCGMAMAYWLYLRRPELPARILALPGVTGLQQFLQGGGGFDRVYDAVLVRPYCWVAQANAHDALDGCMALPAVLAQALHRQLSRTQTGQLRWYAMGLAAGAIVLVILTVWL